MIDLKEAPDSGRILAYAQDRLIYDCYKKQGQELLVRDGTVLNQNGIYELHLFDCNREYRAIYQHEKWHVNVLTAYEEIDCDENHFVISETQFIKKRFQIAASDEKIVVNNRFSFDDEGFLCLDNYRLAMEQVE